MDIYLVGGALRDELLGLTNADRDWVVVGATPQEMLSLGFESVGKDFPVFLHPKTHEEYALARLERKVGPGYRGFEIEHSPHVSLEDDLARRDLTINAIARSKTGEWIDPHGGIKDLQSGILRHVSHAFVEDPVRVLRLARFAARFAHFEVAPETLVLCQTMALSGEMASLVAERVWSEMAKALMTDKPSRFFSVLKSAHALPMVLPHWPLSTTEPQHPAWQAFLLHIDACAQAQLSLAQRYGALFFQVPLLDSTSPQDHAKDESVHWNALATQTSSALRVPKELQEMAHLMRLWSHQMHPTEQKAPPQNAQMLHALAQQDLHLMQAADGFRRPERFAHWMQLLQTILSTPTALSLQTHTAWQLLELQRLREAWLACSSLDLKALNQTGIALGHLGADLGEWIHEQRLHQILKHPD